MTEKSEIEQAFRREFNKSDELLINQVHFEFNKLLNMLDEVVIQENNPGNTYLKMTIKAVNEAQEYFKVLESVKSVVPDRIESNARRL